MRERQHNGIPYKESDKGKWVVVHDGAEIIMFGLSEGYTATRKTIFEGTERQCLTYIADNKIIIPE